MIGPVGCAAGVVVGVVSDAVCVEGAGVNSCSLRRTLLARRGEVDLFGVDGTTGELWTSMLRTLER